MSLASNINIHENVLCSALLTYIGILGKPYKPSPREINHVLIRVNCKRTDERVHDIHSMIDVLKPVAVKKYTLIDVS